MQIRTVPIVDINPAPYNPRRDLKPGDHDYDALSRGIEAFGLVEPLVWNQRTGTLVGGHQRLKILIARGDAEVEVSVVDLDEAHEKLLNIALNEISGEWDLPTLQDLLASLDATSSDLSLTGFTVDELARMMTATFGGVVEDEPPEPPEEPITKPGDIWLCGEHRVMCGDSTKCEDVARLMDGRNATMVFTDPPYGVAYVGKTKSALTIKNDREGFAGTQALVADSLTQAVAFLSTGGAFYVCSPAGDMELPFRLGLIDAGLTLRQQIVWCKDQFVMGRQDYQWRHEAILYGWKDGAAHFFAGGRTQDTVWEIPRPKRSEQHPTMKPVALMAKGIENSSSAGAIVLDPFLGSGTTLATCEQLGRVCYGMELDPRYAQVCIERWQALTGKDAVLEETGERFARIASEKRAVLGG
jgi:DNA modification methylase